jgi:protein-disulfide isomerase
MYSQVFRCLQTRHAFRFRSRISVLLTFASTTLLVVAGASVHAQFGSPSPGTVIHDTSALKPPAGARVAIVEFVDMECPVCGTENPTIKAAAAKYKIPWVRHDFLIPYHAWSPQAAVNARWFDTKSKLLGDEYRDQVFANQSSIVSPDVLLQFTQKFAASHHIDLPFAIDPQGKLAADVKADSDLGRRTGIEHTPTVFIVTSNSKGAPYIEVQHPDQDLYRTIDQAIADTSSPKSTPIKPASAKPASAKPPVKKPAAKSVAPAKTPANK